jgi:hypothetical protein
MARFRALVQHGLTDLPAALGARSQPETMPDLVREGREISARLRARAGRYDRLLAREVERAAWPLSELRTAIGRIAAAAS